MKLQDLHVSTEHERVIECIDDLAGYHAFVAIHSTVRGPAAGGTRLWPYSSAVDALDDVLRLSRGMSYKAAVAGLDIGGGKAVILGDTRTVDRERIFRLHGRFIESLNGQYITAEDVGTTPADMDIIRRETQFVAGLADRSGDPSPFTARGVYRAIEAAVAHRWGADSLGGLRVALQGCGSVGYHLARELCAAGVSLTVADVEPSRTARVVEDVGAAVVAPDEIYGVDVDVFAPCALGGILNDHTIPHLRAATVVGAANNQLLEAYHGEALAERDILYVPDYVANAGGLINGAREVSGWSRERAALAVEAIYDTVLQVLELASSAGVTPAAAADQLAESRLRIPS